MTERETDLRHAASVLGRAIAPGPDDCAHPAYESLEGLVDGRLEAADREVVRSHVDLCQVCSEDVADLSAMRAVMPPVSPAGARVPAWRSYMVAAASIAALAVMAVWLSDYGGRDVADSPVAAVPVPPPPAAPSSALTPDEQAIVGRVSETGRLDLPADLAALGGSVGTLLGEPRQAAPLSAIAPAGTAVLASRPAFSWRPMPGATGYTVTVFDERFAEVARSPKLTSATWTPAMDLPVGRTLAWQMTAHLATGDVNGPAPPHPEARFRVIDATTAATIVDRLSRLANEPLALGILLARAGLFDEASRVLARATADPATRSQAQAVLADLKAR